jgi:transposase
VILAEDEAWMDLQATLMAVWAPRGETPIVRVDPGRKKAGFYGTLNLKTGEEIVTRTAEFNAIETTNHLQQILEQYPHVPILLLWDRAPWHNGEPIREFLEDHPRLEIMKFPTASPDLNPQEQVWKQARKAASHNHIFTKLPELADQFESHLIGNSFSSSFLERYGFHFVCPFLN